MVHQRTAVHHTALKIVNALLFRHIFLLEALVILHQDGVVQGQSAIVLEELVAADFEVFDLYLQSRDGLFADAAKLIDLLDQRLVLLFEIVDNLRVVSELVEASIGGPRYDFDDFRALLLGLFGDWEGSAGKTRRKS